jgi:hypothetical protein
MNDSPRPPLNLEDLFAQARLRQPATDRAQFAFETRLLARIRTEKAAPAPSVWATASWRMIPFFAVGVLGLSLWQGEVATTAQDAAQAAYVENPDAGDLLGPSN